MTRQEENILRAVVEEEPRLFLIDSSAPTGAVLNREWSAADSDEERERIYRDMQLSTM